MLLTDRHRDGVAEFGTGSATAATRLYLCGTVEHGRHAFQGRKHPAFPTFPTFPRAGQAASKRFVFLQTWARADGAAIATSDQAFIHLKAFDLPPQDENLVLNTAGIVELGELLARSYIEHQ